MIDGYSYNGGKRRSIDWAIVGVYLALVFIGWINIYASIHSSAPDSIFDWSVRSGKQFIWILTSFGLAGLILFLIPARLWEGLSVPLYLMVLALLVLVIFVSHDVKGSHSWFELGPIKFQPAEISKITTSLLLALIMSQHGFKISRFRDFAMAALAIGVPMLVIIGESETGSALVYIGFIFVLYREGLSGWLLSLLGLAIALFVCTLSGGAYKALMLLLVALALCMVITGNAKNTRLRIILSAAFIVPMSLFPLAWEAIGSGVQNHLEWMNQVAWVPRAGESAKYFWGFLTGVKAEHVLLALCLVLCPVLLYDSYRKKDMSITLVVVAFVIGVALVLSTDYIFQNVLQPHQRVRIEVLLGMKEDLSGVGYNVHQSKIAIGSGGLFGKGFLHGTQTTFGFVPEQSTDFIFCTVGEEWGFVGCLTVILLYVFLIVRLILDAESCRGAFTRIYGYCVAACIFMHLFINIGMTVGIMPVIGIPLPLLSYGGSSLWAFTIMIFIFLALYREEKKYF